MIDKESALTFKTATTFGVVGGLSSTLISLKLGLPLDKTAVLAFASAAGAAGSSAVCLKLSCSEFLTEKFGVKAGELLAIVTHISVVPTSAVTTAKCAFNFFGN